MSRSKVLGFQVSQELSSETEVDTSAQTNNTEWFPGGRLLEALRRSFWAQLLVVLAIHRWLWPILRELCLLRFDAYFESSLALEILDHPRLLLFLAVNLGLFIVFRRRLAWRAIDPGRRTRVFVVAVAAIMTWSFSTMDYNAFYDQGFLLDRVLIVALLALLWFHPAFLTPFLIVLWVFGGQVNYPLPEAGWVWVDKRLPLDALVLFHSFLYVKILARPRSWFPLFLNLCLTGAVYGHAAVSKMRLGDHLFSWVIENKLSNLVVSSYLNSGWLRPLGEEGIVAFAEFLAPLGLAMAAMVLVVEASGFAIVISPHLTRLILALFVGMHSAILLTSGIFFWKWILFDLALLWYLGRMLRDRKGDDEAEDSSSDGRSTLFGARQRVASILVVAGTSIYFYNVDFAWYDTKFVNFIAVYGVGEDGERYRLEGRYFAPYDIFFQQSRFFYVANEPILVDTFGTTLRPDLAKKLEEIEPSGLPDLMARRGRSRYSPIHANRFAFFLQRWISNAESRRGETFLPHVFAPPFHFQMTPAADAYRETVPLERAEVDLVRYFFDSGRIVPLGSETVMVVNIRRDEAEEDTNVDVEGPQHRGVDDR